MEFRIGTQFKLWPHDTLYELTDMYIGIGEGGNWLAKVEYREVMTAGTEQTIPLFMFEELVKSSDIYQPESEKFVSELMRYRGKGK